MYVVPIGRSCVMFSVQWRLNQTDNRHTPPSQPNPDPAKPLERKLPSFKTGTGSKNIHVLPNHLIIKPNRIY